MENETEKLEVLLEKVIDKHQEILSWKKSGDLVEKLYHVLGQYRQIADNAIYSAKTFIEDCKTQYKALEIIAEGLTDEGLNHTHKRVIANHMISILRKMVERLNDYQYEYSTTAFQRYDFFRSQTPEKKLHEAHRELKYKTEAQEKILKTLKEVHPDIWKALNSSDEIPF